MIVDFRLKVFATVANFMSFTKAAAELNISQPAVTKHIKELESEVGEALFRRQGSRISLTQMGEIVLPQVESILGMYSKLNDSIDDKTEQFRGVINLGVSTTIIQYVLPSILAKFKKEYPNVDVRLVSGNSEEIEDLVIDSKADLALVEGNSFRQALHYESFADDHIVLVTAKGKRSKLSVDDIVRLPLVIRENGSGTLAVIEKALSKIGISRKELNVVIQIGSSEGIIRYLMNSSAYAFISIAAAKDHIAQGEIKIVNITDFTIDRSFRYAYLHGNHNRLVELFKSFCRVKYNF